VADDLVVVARVARTRGLRGKCWPIFIRISERFEGLEQIMAIAPDSSSRSLQLKSIGSTEIELCLSSRVTIRIDAAKDLAGYQLAVPASERIELPKDHFYEWELAGCRSRLWTEE